MVDALYKPLQMAFLLKVQDSFLSEAEAAQQLDSLRAQVKSGQVDLETTDGAWSIRYYEEELLGEEFWDEINIAIDQVMWQLSSLHKGNSIEIFLPLQSLLVSLTPQGENLLFQVSSQTLRRAHSLTKSLPQQLFLQEFFAMYIRMVKLLAALGSRSFQRTLNEWRSQLPNFVSELVTEERSLQNMLQTPLSALEESD